MVFFGDKFPSYSRRFFLSILLIAILSILIVSPVLAYDRTNIKGKQVTTDNIYASGEIGIGTDAPAGIFQE